MRGHSSLGPALVAVLSGALACNAILDIPEYGPRPASGGSAGASGGGAGGASGKSGKSGSGGTSQGKSGAGGSDNPGGSAGAEEGGNAGEPASGGSAGTSGNAGSGGASGDGSGGSEAGAGGESGGGSSCETGESECGELCVDVRTDPEHCARCGHSCEGGMCNEGQCSPLTLATDRGRLMMVAVVGDHVYYGGDGVDVRRVNKDGTNDIVIAAAGETNEMKEWTYTWAVTPDALVWGNDWVHTAIRGCTLPDCTGGAQSFVPTSTNRHALGYASANSTLYFDEGSAVRARVWPSGSVSDFALDQDSIGAIAADTTNLYWSSCSFTLNSCEVRRKAFAGGTITPIVTGRTTAPWGFAVASGRLYWAEGTSVYAVPLPDGSTTPTPIGTSTANARELAVSSAGVFWTVEMSGNGAVLRCPLDGCTEMPEILTTFTVKPWGVAVDDDAVYWVTEAGQVGKLAL
jgi:hypothetical protein